MFHHNSRLSYICRLFYLINKIYIIYISWSLIDPISAFAKNYLSKTNRRLKKNSIFNSISNAIKELQLDISIISEKCIENATINTDARQIRINELATILSPTYVIIVNY